MVRSKSWYLVNTTEKKVHLNLLIVLLNQSALTEIHPDILGVTTRDLVDLVSIFAPEERLYRLKDIKKVINEACIPYLRNKYPYLINLDAKGVNNVNYPLWINNKAAIFGEYKIVL